MPHGARARSPASIIRQVLATAPGVAAALAAAEAEGNTAEARLARATQRMATKTPPRKKCDACETLNPTARQALITPQYACLISSRGSVRLFENDVA